MELRCIWEHNGRGSLLFAEALPGAFSRGETLAAALEKMPAEAAAWLRWQGSEPPELIEPRVVQEHECALSVEDADSEVIFDSERLPLDAAEYGHMKELALCSAQDFERLYSAVPDKDASYLAPRRTFYGPVPRTAREMYGHTKNVNAYYFGEIGVEADNDGGIALCRERGFASLERARGFLQSGVFSGSYGEEWSLRKLLRRFLWHDRIHARAMYRMALRTFGGGIPDVFRFGARRSVR